jgi:hypothetical protein
MKLAALGAATAALPALAKTKRNLEVGHTGITWPNDVMQAITDTGNLGTALKHSVMSSPNGNRKGACRRLSSSITYRSSPVTARWT